MVDPTQIYSNILECVQIVTLKDIRPIIKIVLRLNPKSAIIDMVDIDKNLGLVYDIVDSSWKIKY